MALEPFWMGEKGSDGTHSYAKKTALIQQPELIQVTGMTIGAIDIFPDIRDKKKPKLQKSTCFARLFSASSGSELPGPSGGVTSVPQSAANIAAS